MSIYVGNLAFEVEDKHLSDIFSDYGKVTRVYMPTDRETGQRRGFAFVEMETPQMEDAAISALDGAEWMERELKVNKARERENRNSGGGGNYRRNNRY
ncbi:RNP-1 like RNA-binding protein [Gloeothece citriformis PCC 7424]|uniref:RNP-1 like RNA-binding protein n=1 Tax=Gloeothece citriformis (strain PCC 7424) TaxID=65393 RepID=B7K8V4_GLOC7|nr:RNA-binding protein [Gloeothece citriformis]ACK72723.1 RNP-1 like RNA-binding protein [Gloeothece citriformis PCC 7424]